MYNGSHESESSTSFLQEYDNLYVPPLEGKDLKKKQKEDKKETEKQRKDHDRMMKEAQKVPKKPVVEKNTSDDIEMKTLKIKVKQYQLLFPDETAAFFKTPLGKKLNKTMDELNTCIAELDILVNMGAQGYDCFINEMICASVASAEKYGKLVRCDISGLSARLRANKEFDSICKRIFMKYGSSYSTFSIEVQLCCIIVVQGFIQMKENTMPSTSAAKSVL